MAMAQPIVFISRFRIRAGGGPAFASVFTAMVPRIESSKPRTALYAAYLDADEAELRIVHAFPDAAAMADHFEGSDERAAMIADLVDTLGYEVYGPAPPAAIEQLAGAAAASGATLSVFPIAIDGYLRSRA